MLSAAASPASLRPTITVATTAAAAAAIAPPLRAVAVPPVSPFPVPPATAPVRIVAAVFRPRSAKGRGKRLQLALTVFVSFGDDLCFRSYVYLFQVYPAHLLFGLSKRGVLVSNIPRAPWLDSRNEERGSRGKKKNVLPCENQTIIFGSVADLH